MVSGASLIDLRGFESGVYFLRVFNPFADVSVARVSDNKGSLVSSPDIVGSVGDSLYFVSGGNLFRGEGGNAELVYQGFVDLLDDILVRNVPTAADPDTLIAEVEGGLYFTIGNQIWFSDGVYATHHATLGVGKTVTDVIGVGNRLVFVHDDGDKGVELWSTGPAEGVVNLGASGMLNLQARAGGSEYIADVEIVDDVALTGDEAQVSYQGGLRVLTRSEIYTWTRSTAFTDEFYLTLADGTDPGLSVPANIFKALTQLNKRVAGGTPAALPLVVGAMEAGIWEWDNKDSLGFETVYVRLKGDVVPSDITDGHLTVPETPKLTIRINAGVTTGATIVNAINGDPNGRFNAALADPAMSAIVNGPVATVSTGIALTGPMLDINVTAGVMPASTASSNPTDLTRIGDVVYFFANDGTQDRLFYTNGRTITSASNVQQPTLPNDPVVINNKLFYTVDLPAAAGVAIWTGEWLAGSLSAQSGTKVFTINNASSGKMLGAANDLAFFTI